MRAKPDLLLATSPSVASRLADHDGRVLASAHFQVNVIALCRNYCFSTYWVRKYSHSPAGPTVTMTMGGLRSLYRARRSEQNYALAAAPLENDWMAVASSFFTSKTVSKWVTLRRSSTCLFGFNSLRSPP